MKKIFILVLTFILTLSIAACNSKKPSNSASVSIAPSSNTTTMNLTQIQSGNYSSLQGTWTEVAYAYNPQDTTGIHWKSGVSPSDDTLTVTSDKINFDDSFAIIKGNTITDHEGSHSLKFKNDGDSLYAWITDQYSANAWEVRFYPKGADVTKDLNPNDGVKIDNTKNIIYIFVTGDNQVVFEQTDTK